jgi:hypothetical protein
MAINTSSKCSTCDGTVKNIDGKRHTIERLTTIHNETCPGIRRVATTRKATSDE